MLAKNLNSHENTRIYFRYYFNYFNSLLLSIYHHYIIDRDGVIHKIVGRKEKRNSWEEKKNAYMTRNMS